MAGIARENVTRILNDWERRKLASRLSGYYCLENKALLEHQAKDNSAATKEARGSPWKTQAAWVVRSRPAPLPAPAQQT
jgi:hypothetical protein